MTNLQHQNMSDQIGNLPNLQILVADFTHILSLPDNITGLSTLQVRILVLKRKSFLPCKRQRGKVEEQDFAGICKTQ